MAFPPSVARLFTTPTIMGDLHKLKKKNESNRRTALLGLASSAGTGVTDDCLTPEEMACLVNGKCTTKERHRFLEHLGICARCYRHWLALHAIEVEEKKGQAKIFSFLRWGNLAWAGSALAAAASVALFLNIIGDTGPTLYKSQVSEERRMDSLHAPAPQGSIVRSEDKVVKEDMQPLEKELAAPVPIGRKSEPVSQGRSKKSPVSDGAITVPQAADQAMMMEAVPEEKEESLSVMQAAPSLKTYDSSGDEWLVAVQEACLRTENDPTFWQEQYVVGGILLKAQKQDITGFLEGEQGRRFVEILLWVEQLSQGAKAEELCRKIEKQLE